MAVLLKKWLRNYRDYGLGFTLQKALKYFASIIVDAKIYRIYRINLEHYKPHSIPKLPYALKWVTPEDKQCISQIEKLEEWLVGKINTCLQRGGLCLCALDGPRLVGFNLVNLRELNVPIIKKKIEFSPGKAWSQQISVNKAYRGKGVAITLRYEMFQKLQGMGIRNFYGGALIGNKGSLMLAQKVGMDSIVDVHYSKWLRRVDWKYLRKSIVRKSK